MEKFQVQTSRIVNNSDGTIYYELVPINIALKDLILKGCEGVEVELINNRIDMFETLQHIFPEVAINYYL